MTLTEPKLEGICMHMYIYMYAVRIFLCIQSVVASNVGYHFLFNDPCRLADMLDWQRVFSTWNAEVQTMNNSVGRHNHKYKGV